MKRAVLLIVILVLFLSGCTYSSGDRQFIVSSVGFSAEGENIEVTAEIIIINSESEETDPVPKVMTGRGKTISEAFDEIGAGLAKPMLLEHCGVIIISKEMTAEWFGKICDYCFSENRITLSAYMISAEKPQKLLSQKPESSVSVGYDLMGIIEQQTERTGILYDNRYFEVESKREKGEDTFILPHFAVSEDMVEVDGVTLFYKDEAVFLLDNRKSEIYALMTGNYSKGRIRIGAEEYDITSRKTEYSYKDEKNNEIILKLELSGDKNGAPPDEKLEYEILNLEKELREKLNTDIFGFTNTLSKRYSKFRKNYGNAEDFYRTAKFTADCRFTGGKDNAE